MRAHDVMTSPAITCHVNDPLNVAARRMWDADIGALAVVNDDGKLTGMVTDRDICMAASTQGRALDEMLVNSAMAKHVVSAAADASLVHLEYLMAKQKVRRIPIVDGEGKPIGIVSINDLVIESVQPDSSMKHGPSRIAHTLAAISQPRSPMQKAA